MKQKPKQTVDLKRSLTLPLLVFYGVGTILGLGIYVLTGKIAGEAGMYAPFAFLVAAILAGFTGISYGELSARIPKSAGEVNYVNTAFKKRVISIAVGWLIVLSAIISTSTVVNGYVGYVQVFFDIPDWMIITLITVVLGAVAAWGIKESAYTIAIITFIEFIGILIVVVVGFDNLQTVNEWSAFVPGFTWSEWQPVLAGAFLAFFAFIGFEDMVNVAEETKNPQKNMPKAIIISLIILTVLYILVAMVAVTGLSAEALDNSDAPLADILTKKGEGYTKVIGLISLVAIVNGVLVQIVMGARVLYGMADQKMASQWFGKVNPKTRTPLIATTFMVGIILILALIYDLETLARATNYILLLVFAVVNLSLWKLKRDDPKPEGVRTYPVWVPILGFVFSLTVLIIEALTSVLEVL